MSELDVHHVFLEKILLVFCFIRNKTRHPLHSYVPMQPYPTQRITITCTDEQTNDVTDLRGTLSQLVVTLIY